MAKYYYDKKEECFRGNKGKPLYVNSGEANRIAHMVDLGYPTTKINKKVSLSSVRSGKTTVDNFVKHYKKGEIKVPSNAPVQSNLFERVIDEKKVSDLEKRIVELESKLSEMESEKPKKSWKERLGL